MAKKDIRLLIVEDEEAIRKGLADTFVFHGYDVATSARGDEGLERAQRENFDLVILDIMLPGKSGFEVCDALKEPQPELAIIMLTAKSNEEDIIEGLSLGADDYVTKPFSLQELLLRVEAVLRRARPEKTAIPKLLFEGGLEIDCLNATGVNKPIGVSEHGEEVRFTRREIDILLYLFSHEHRPISRDELLKEVWDYKRQAEIETRTVDIHIAKLRKKIEVDPKNPRFLITIRGEGYKLLGASKN